MIFDRNPRARDYKVSQLVAAIRASLESNWQPYGHIAQLQKQWSTERPRISRDYLSHTTRTALDANGPVVECGSGLTTILLGLVAERTGTPVMTFEHDPIHLQRIKAVMETNHIHSVDILHAPLIPYGDYDWYDVSQVSLPDHIQLIVCNGPPQQLTSGGRYGMWPLLESHMKPQCKILLDDYQQTSKRLVTEKWSSSTQLQVESFGRLAPFAEITCPN